MVEGVSAVLYRSIKRYWRRRHYERLDGSASSRRRVRFTTAGGRRRWRIKLPSRFRIASPRKILMRLRDGYTRMMLRLASSSAFVGGQALGYSDPFGAPPLKEYDEKVMVEIYKSLAEQGRFVAGR
ncbi:uncharacterized protein LOC116254808 [Nymphaea colorata]|uniref:uncharacterized protein LOC116254808 n=1 Tax=Nymphaea colorata TaxID=210225 RepID=UPI00129E899F|nr:uncharacterized protein LOC116254808 [Nymphaea colorata]